MTKREELREVIQTWTDISVQRSWRSWGHFAKSIGLSMQQFSILMQLHYRGTCGVSDISDRFEITNPAASQLVEKLVQAGYLERAEDPEDRRAKLITLSRKGKALVGRSIEEGHLWLDELLDHLETALTGPERDQATEIVRNFIEAHRKLNKVPQ